MARDWEPGRLDRQPHHRAQRRPRAHPALRELRTLRFHGSTDDEHLLVYSKTAPDGADPVLVVVNLDPVDAHEGLLHLDLGVLGMPATGPYEVARRAHRRGVGVARAGAVRAPRPDRGPRVPTSSLCERG